MSNPQESKILRVIEITSGQTFQNFEELVILDHDGVGFTLQDSSSAVGSFAAGGNISSLHIGGPGKPVNEITITPVSGTIIVLLYQ